MRQSKSWLSRTSSSTHARAIRFSRSPAFAPSWPCHGMSRSGGSWHAFDWQSSSIATRASSRVAITTHCVYTRLLLSVGERVRGARHPVLAMSRSRSALAKRFDALLRRDVIDPRRAVGLAVLAAGMLASVAFVPAPSVSEIVNLVRPARAEAVVVAPVAAEPAGRVTDVSTANAALAASSTAPIVQRAPRPTSTRRRTLTPNVDVNTLPPVSVVPPAAGRNTLDSIVVARAAVLPAARPTGGMITAMPNGARGRGGRGGFTARPTTSGADSNVVTARGGGRAVLVPRPDTVLVARRDTIRPPS